MKPGVNLIGYAKSEQGIGEGCRLTANALAETDIDWKVVDWEINNPSRQNDITLSDKIVNSIDNNVSIININADQLVYCKKQFPKDIWDTYRIGVWYWELEELPDKWDEAFNLVDEIWAPTIFIQDCLMKKAKCPVLHMPPGLKREEPLPEYNRAYFGLPKDAFLFLNMFDAFSFSSRKNPKAVIDAFKRAFKPDDMSVGLVLKVNNVDSTNRLSRELKKLIRGYKNIYLIPKIMSRDEVNGLMNACDAVVSLHRSEGLGLLCQEAMYYGKPVIATAWSGNMDFMNSENSCLVGYKKIPVDCYYGMENGSDLEWADADVNEAAKYMKDLYSDREYRERIASAGKRTIREEFSPEVCGKRMEERLNQIQVSLDLKSGSHVSLLNDQDHIRNIESMNRSAYVSYYEPAEFSGRYKRIKKVIYRVAYKLCKAIIRIIMEQQNEFNFSISRVIAEQEKEIQLLREENTMLKNRLNIK